MGINLEYFFPKENCFGHVGDLVGSPAPHFCFGSFNKKNKIKVKGGYLDFSLLTKLKNISLKFI